MKILAILGSTGSIGRNCLEVARHLGKEKVCVAAIAAKNNIDLLERQALEFAPELIAVFDEVKALELKKRLPNFTILGGMEGLIAVATYHKANLTISAISGAIGLEPTVAAIDAKKNIGFATKEVLVSGGSFITELAKKNNVHLIPIDSELTAIFQCLKSEETKAVQRLIITASGGPFRGYSNEQLDSVNVERALNHPNYLMGPKVTIDSSTLMNKGLEMIEAHHLFNLPVNQIEIIVHPEQIIHGVVEFVDNSLLAHFGDADMLIPIQYAITYPNRDKGKLTNFDFFKKSSWHFFAPDLDKFRCLKLAYEAIECGKSLPCYMNAANEVLVERFLKNEISWKNIATSLEKVMAEHICHPICSLQDIFAIDSEARQRASLLKA